MSLILLDKLGIFISLSLIFLVLDLFSELLVLILLLLSFFSFSIFSSEFIFIFCSFLLLVISSFFISFFWKILSKGFSFSDSTLNSLFDGIIFSLSNFDKESNDDSLAFSVSLIIFIFIFSSFEFLFNSILISSF